MGKTLAIGGACCAFVGLVLIIAGAVIPGIIIGAAKGAVKEILTDEFILTKKELEEVKDYDENAEATEVYTVFNLTNLPEVLTGSKPKFAKVVFNFFRYCQKYDITVANGEASYSDWCNYTVHPDTIAKYNSTDLITQVNPQYIVGVKQEMGTEDNMMVAVANRGVDPIKGLFIDTLPAMIPLLTFNSYILGVQGSVVSVMNGAQVLGQWISTSGSDLATLTGSPAFKYFELRSFPSVVGLLAMIPGQGGGLPQTQAAYLWDPSSTFSLIPTSMSVLAWSPFLQCLAGHGANATANCFNSGDIGAAIAAALDLGDGSSGAVYAMAVGTWILSVGQTAEFFAIVKGTLAAVGLDSAVAASATSFADLSAAQFGSSALSRMSAFGGIDSMQAMFGLTFAPEISAYASSLGVSMSLTAAQSVAFLTKFSVLENVMAFAYTMAAAAAGDLSGMANYVDVGIMSVTSPPNMAGTLMFGYMTQHLSRHAVIPTLIGPLGPDKIHTLRGGMFIKNTAKEIFEGWVDPVVTALSPTSSYNGLLGRQFADIAAQKAYEAANPSETIPGNSRNRVFYTGDSGSAWEKARSYKSYAKNTEITTRNQLGYDCDSVWSKYNVLGYNASNPSATCKAWASSEVIDGSDVSTHSRPYMGEVLPSNYMDIQSEFTTKPVWVNKAMRQIDFVFEKFEDVKGIRAQRFGVKGTVYKDAINHTANAKYYMHDGNVMLPLEHVTEKPVVLSAPGFMGAPGNVTSCFDLTGGAFPTERNPEDEPYFMVEPITGLTIKGKEVLQVNWKITKSGHGQLYASSSTMPGDGNIFTHCDTLYWPYVTVAQVGLISDSDSTKFKEALYDTMKALKTLPNVILAVFLVIGFLLLVCSAGCIYMGMKSKPGDNNKSMQPNQISVVPQTKVEAWGPSS